MVGSWLLGAAVARAACEAPRPKGELDAALGRGEVAIANLDPDGLSAAVADAHAVLPCLADGLATTDVARWFRVTGLERFTAGSGAEAAERFRAARSLEPAFQLDPALGQPIRDAWQAAPPTSSGTRPLTPPTVGWLQVDGRRSTDAPVDRPFVAQWFDGTGAVGWTGEVGTGDPLPADLVARMGRAPAPSPAPVAHHGHASPILLGAGLGLAALGAGAIGGAAAVEGAFDRSPELSSSDVNQSRIHLNHALGWSGIGGCAAGAGLVVGAVIAGQW